MVGSGARYCPVRGTSGPERWWPCWAVGVVPVRRVVPSGWEVVAPASGSPDRCRTRSGSAMSGQDTVGSRIVDPAHLPFAYADALNAGDADAVLALFRQDATMRTFSGEVLTGREALRAEAVRSIAAQVRLTNKPGFTQTGGDTALIVVDWN